MSRKLIFIALAVVCTSFSSFAGWEYTAVTKGGGSQHVEIMNSQIKSWVDGDLARINFTRSGNPMMPAGSFVITKDGGKTMYMVDPRKKSYPVWDVQGTADDNPFMKIMQQMNKK